MRITPLLLAKKNLIEAYHDRSIIYSIFFPSLFLLLTRNFNGAIIGLAFVLGALYDALLALPREIGNGTLVKILLSPVSQWSIIGGRMISSFVLNIPKAALVLVLTNIGPFKLDIIGSNNSLGMALFYVVSSLITLLTVVIGLFCSAISSFFKANPNSAILLATSVILLLAVPPALFNQGSVSQYTNFKPLEGSYKIIEFIKSTDSSKIMQTFPGDNYADVLWIIVLFMVASICLRRRIA
jgi:hypothetical protein